MPAIGHSQVWIAEKLSGSVKSHVPSGAAAGHGWLRNSPFGSGICSKHDTEERVQGLFGTTAIGIAGGLSVAWLLTDNMAPDRGARTQSANHSLKLRSSFQAVKGGSVLGVSGAF